MLTGSAALASGTLGGIYVGVMCGGLVYGMYWTVVPLVFGDLFGLEHLGANYKTCTFAEAAAGMKSERFECGLEVRCAKKACGRHSPMKQKSTK